MSIKPSIRISGREISETEPVYVIAEMSANHNGSYEKATAIIDAAKLAGADAVKLQTYKPDTITLKCDSEDFQIHGGLWNGKNLYDLYEEAHMPWDWHKPLFDYATSKGITIFSSPFDNTAVDLLEDLNAPAYKVASFEAIDIPLIRYIAKTGKPMIISTGMANVEEIHEAIDAAKSGGCEQIAILHCVSGYPAHPSEYNLLTIKDMITRFGVVTGLSDHTLDNVTALTSVTMGASIIEKHFTLDRNGGGPDDTFSLEPAQLQNLCESIRVVQEAIGTISYERKTSELGNVKFRRSLYFVKNIRKNEIITNEHVRSIRPGFGLEPKHIELIIGKKIKKDAFYGTPVKWEYVI